MFGKAGKAGGLRRPQQVPAGQGGPTTPGNMIPDAGVRAGRNPIAFSLAHRLGIMSALTSPAVAGRFRPQDQSAPYRRSTEDLGALQAFRGLVGGPGRATVGAQGGPGSQPGYPSTNGSILVGLAAMDQPGLQRIGGLG